MQTFQENQTQKEIVFQLLTEMCDKIFSQEKDIENIKFFNINLQIDSFLSQFQSDDRSKCAKEIIKIVTTNFQKYLTNQIEFYQVQEDPNLAISQFFTFQANYQRKQKPILKLLYKCLDELLVEDFQEFVIDLLDNLFATSFQRVFEENLFPSIIKLIEILLIDRSLLQQFYDFYAEIERLQSICQSKLNYQVGVRLEEHIFKYFKERSNSNFYKWISNSTILDYLIKVQHETKIIQTLLEPINRILYQRVFLIIYTELVTNYKSFLNTEQQTQIQNPNDNKESFNIILQFLDNHNNQLDFYEKFQQNVLCEGRKIISDYQIESNNLLSTDLIQKFYGLYKKYRNLIKDWLSDSDDFVTELNKAFNIFMVTSVGKCQFTDCLITYIGDEIENQRNTPKDLSNLFIFVNSNELFLSAYQMHLAQRLIKYQQYYPPTEKSIILNSEVKAVEILAEQFQGNKKIQALFFMIEDVLNSNIEQCFLINEYHWPKICKKRINIESGQKFQQKNKRITPIDLVTLVEVFWHEKQISFTMSLPQAVILFLFQFNNEEKTIDEIAQKTGMNTIFIQKNCQLMKESLILIENAVDKVPSYSFNENFQSNRIPAFLDINFLINPRNIEPQNIEEPFSQQNSDYKIDLPPTSAEYQIIFNKFKKSDRGKIISISKIYNKYLWETYLSEKYKLIEKRLQEGNPLTPSEEFKYVWHGVKGQHPQVIYTGNNQGFDPTKCERGNWGKGTYFARKACQSRSYAYEYREIRDNLPQKRRVFLCCIITTGKLQILQKDQNLRGPSEGFDCVCGDESIFVLYGAATRRAYPAYEVVFI